MKQYKVNILLFTSQLQMLIHKRCSENGIIYNPILDMLNPSLTIWKLPTQSLYQMDGNLHPQIVMKLLQILSYHSIVIILEEILFTMFI